MLQAPPPRPHNKTSTPDSDVSVQNQALAPHPLGDPGLHHRHQIPTIHDRHLQHSTNLDDHATLVRGWQSSLSGMVYGNCFHPKNRPVIRHSVKEKEDSSFQLSRPCGPFELVLGKKLHWVARTVYNKWATGNLWFSGVHAKFASFRGILCRLLPARTQVICHFDGHCRCMSVRVDTSWLRPFQGCNNEDQNRWGACLLVVETVVQQAVFSGAHQTIATPVVAVSKDESIVTAQRSKILLSFLWLFRA